MAKPWIVESPAPLTCQSLAGSPGNEFSQAITLTTGGPQGPAAAAGRMPTKENMLSSTASASPIAARRLRARQGKSPATDIIRPPRTNVIYIPNYLHRDAQVAGMDGKNYITKRSP